MAIEARLGREDGFAFYDEDVGVVQKKKGKLVDFRATSPEQIKELLDEHIVGQDEAKRIVATAYYNHLKRAQAPGMSKSNIILIGDTGTGKTLIAERLARAVKVPFVIEDASRYTKKGYVGGDVDDIIEDLYEKAEHDIKACERGIVYLDECDKLCHSEGVGNGGISGKAVQNELLKIVEGTEIRVKDGQKINTKGILFVAGGAFSGIDEIIEDNRRGSRGIGFASNQDTEERPSIVSAEDLIAYGMTPEFTGRFPVVARLTRLSEDELVRVLTEPKESVCKEFEKLFSMDGAKLSFDPPALKQIAKMAATDKTGARGLRAIMEEALLGDMFTAKKTRGAEIRLVYDKKNAKIVTRTKKAATF